MNNSFRSLIISILDDSHGIDNSTYLKLVAFSNLTYPGLLDDVFNSANGGDGRVWLEEGTAEQLRGEVE